MLKIKKLRLPGPFLIEPKIFRDKRGFLYETWNEELYFKSKIKSKIVQVVYSHSKKNALRGIHFQYPNLQGKLVSVINGKIWYRVRVGKNLPYNKCLKIKNKLEKMEIQNIWIDKYQ